MTASELGNFDAIKSQTLLRHIDIKDNAKNHNILVFLVISVCKTSLSLLVSSIRTAVNDLTRDRDTCGADYEAD